MPHISVPRLAETIHVRYFRMSKITETLTQYVCVKCRVLSVTKQPLDIHAVQVIQHKAGIQYSTVGLIKQSQMCNSGLSSTNCVLV